MSRRTHRVEELLQTQLAELLVTEARDPRLEGAHIVGVAVAPDLTSAQVRVSMMAEEDAQQAALAALDKASGFFRSRLAKRLKHMRRIPTLNFRIDRGAEHSQRIHDLLENLE